jgi:hypothetical protein
MSREVDLPVFVRILEDRTVGTLSVKEDPPESFFHPHMALPSVCAKVEAAYRDAVLQWPQAPVDRLTLDKIFSDSFRELEAAGLLPEQRRLHSHH